ncbi:MAG: replication protein [archaeon]
MPSPQTEDGHLDLANELVDQFCRLNLSACEWRVLWAILRKTYGWHKKFDRISYSQFENLTGLDRWHIRRYLNRLIKQNIITKTGSGQRLFYAFQKDYSLWKPLPKQATVETITQTGYGLLPKQATKPLPEQATTKEKKETIKRNGAKPVSLASLFSEIESSFSPEDLKHKDEFLDYWTESNPNGKLERWHKEEFFDVKRRFQTWLRNNSNWNHSQPLKPAIDPSRIYSTIEVNKILQENPSMSMSANFQFTGVLDQFRRLI